MVATKSTGNYRHGRHTLFLIVLAGIALAGSLALYVLTMPIGVASTPKDDAAKNVNQNTSVTAASDLPTNPPANQPANVREYLTDIPSATMIAVGDIMLGRNVETLRQKKGNTYPFDAVSQFFWNADFVMANLEGPIPSPELHSKTPGGSFSFSFDESVPGLLSAFNVWAVGLANNHMWDQGKKGLDNTHDVLEKQGIAWFGHPSEVTYKYATHREINGERLSFVGFNMVGQNFDTAAASDVVARAKKDKDSHVMVAIHWGEEYATTTSVVQRTIAHALIDAGADVIWGSHPHVVQPVELYRDKPIFYSLGNFIFDQYFSKDVERGLAVKVSFFPTEVRYDLFPVRSYQSQPSLMTGEERDVWLKLFAASALKHITRLTALFRADQDDAEGAVASDAKGAVADTSAPATGEALTAAVGDALENIDTKNTADIPEAIAAQKERAKQFIKDLEKGYFVVGR